MHFYYIILSSYIDFYIFNTESSAAMTFFSHYEISRTIREIPNYKQYLKSLKAEYVENDKRNITKSIDWYNEYIYQEFGGLILIFQKIEICLNHQIKHVHQEGRDRIEQLQLQGVFRDSKGAQGSNHTFIIDLLEQVRFLPIFKEKYVSSSF